MPSYDKISNAKASVETVDGLAVEPLSGQEVRTQPIKDKNQGTEGEQPSIAAGLLPSLSKKGSLAAKKAPKEKKADAPRQSVADVIEQKKQEKMIIVDTSLPSYQDSTATKDKGIFAF